MNTSRIAHELAGLIDGGRRNVDLALSSLREHSQTPDDPQDDAAALERLEAATDAMNRMADLLRRWMDSLHEDRPLEHDNRTLTDAVAHAVRLLTPAAEKRGVHVEIKLGSDAANVTAGPLYAVIANALRNAIEAIDSQAADDPRRGSRIEVAARVVDGQLRLTITDDGPGLDPALVDATGHVRPGSTTKPDGHGLGLQLCHEIAVSLSGNLSLANAQPHGAVLTLACPVEALDREDAR